MNEFGLPPDRFSGFADDLVEAHGADSSAQTATDVNADSASCATHAADMAVDTRKTFWERLIEAWGPKGHPTSQLGVANKLGMSQGSVGRWARDEGLPELDTVRELANLGDVCVEWLLTGKGPRRPTPVDEETNELLEVWRQLDPNGRHHVRVAARAMLADQKGRKSIPLPAGVPDEIPEK